MTRTIVVTGTDTEIGKTVFSAALTGALDGCYWKPVQAGLDDGSDRERVAALAGVSADRVLPEAYRLTTPCSPHQAADIDGVTIEADRLTLLDCDRPLVVEGAGGALVPLTRELTYADMFARWKEPTVIVARTALGTINHSLLTIEALRARDVPLLGIAFVGEANAETESVIVQIGGVRRLGRLPHLPSLTPETLRAAFTNHFHIEDFR